MAAGTPMAVAMRDSKPTVNPEYGKNRLHAVMELRRQQEADAPRDEREELSRYEAECATEPVADILK